MPKAAPSGDETRVPMPSRAVIEEFDPKARALSIGKGRPAGAAEGVPGSTPFLMPLARAI